MRGYLLLEIVTVAYTANLWSRSLSVGTARSLSVILGGLLVLAVLSVSKLAALLLLPYILWSSIGTYTTWRMMSLNPESE